MGIAFGASGGSMEEQLPGQAGEGDGGLGRGEGGNLREHLHVGQGRQREKVRVDQTRHNLMQENERGRWGEDYFTLSFIFMFIEITLLFNTSHPFPCFV